MIPRKEAARFLSEFIRAAEQLDGADRWRLGEAADRLLATSDLVLRGAESVEQKARRLLAEGRLTVTAIRADGTVVAECRGTDRIHRLGFDGKRQEWRCTCEARGRCSHLAALQLVTVRSGGGT